MRENGYYWVKNEVFKNSDGEWVVAFFENGEWQLSGLELCYLDSDFIEIDPTPITRISPINLTHTSQTLATLKETLSDLPDSLLVTEVKIVMHNKYSIQITEFYAEPLKLIDNGKL